MTHYIALLRAVNVGGTGKLPMSDLKAMCEEAGFASVRTYIASGNVVFESARSAAQVKAALEKLLAAYAGKPVGVMVRTGQEMAEVLASNPFPDGAPNRTMAIFLDNEPAADTIATAKHHKDEQIALGRREIYVHYGDGIGDSKLVLQAQKEGTARNMNTVAKLVQMAKS
jgi:uncharacterized protein (DUF1697 family)